MKVACVTENCTRTPISGAVAGALYLSLPLKNSARTAVHILRLESCVIIPDVLICTDTVHFQHLLAYKTLAQSCSVWDLINGTLEGLVTDSRHFSPSSIYERSVESTGTRRPNARLPISFEVLYLVVLVIPIILETQDFYEVLLHIHANNSWNGNKTTNTTVL